ncbi:MAG: KilA-N domain-containing protein [Bacillota bacterium]|nr:KilA-N domain-containing protein [Bacillota bacterium]
MSKQKNLKATMDVNGNPIAVISNGIDQNDFISITDIAKYKNKDDANDVIKNWLRNRNTIDFLGLWETLNNPEFKPVEFDGFRIEAGTNAFVLSPKKWIETTGAIGLISKAGRYGGTYAHKDIAFEFASWVSAEFKLYIIKEYQRLKEDENSRLSLDWNINRTLSKINYKIHTDAIKEHLIPEILPKQRIGITYASEADLLNVALFGMTAKDWRDGNQDKKGNIRDYATIEQLIVLANLESYNAQLIAQELEQPERLVMLNQMAQKQMVSLIENKSVERLNNSKMLIEGKLEE